MNAAMHSDRKESLDAVVFPTSERVCSKVPVAEHVERGGAAAALLFDDKDPLGDVAMPQDAYVALFDGAKARHGLLSDGHIGEQTPRSHTACRVAFTPPVTSFTEDASQVVEADTKMTDLVDAGMQGREDEGGTKREVRWRVLSARDRVTAEQLVPSDAVKEQASSQACDSHHCSGTQSSDRVELGQGTEAVPGSVDAGQRLAQQHGTQCPLQGDMSQQLAPHGLSMHASMPADDGIGHSEREHCQGAAVSTRDTNAEQATGAVHGPPVIAAEDSSPGQEGKRRKGRGVWKARKVNVMVCYTLLLPNSQSYPVAHLPASSCDV
jgi:hypothetical protein